MNGGGGGERKEFPMTSHPGNPNRAAPHPVTSHPMAPYSVAIAGAGPTGLTLANLLGREGVATLLIERNEATVAEPRAVSIDDESLRTLQAAGLAGEVASRMVPGYGSIYHTPGRRPFLAVQPSESPYGYPRRNAFRQPVLEKQLLAGLDRFPEVTPWFGQTLESFRQTDRGVVLSVKDTQGRIVEVECGFLIGCDGAASTVRRLLGIEMAGSSFSERWLIVDMENSTNNTRHTEVFCDPRRPCITLPGPDRTRRFEFMLHPHESEGALLRPETVRGLLAAHGADMNATIVRTAVYTFHARMATRWGEGRVLLAGDAAHLTPPFAGQGMNSGLRDAHNLAWKLAMIARGEAGAGLLESYPSERRGHAWQMIQLALGMGWIMRPRTRLSAWMVQTGFRLLGLAPPVRDYFAQMRFKPKPRFTAGFLIPGRGAARRLAGRLFPQPHVTTADGRRVLLDEVLGNRFALLAFTSDPGGAFGGTFGGAFGEAAHPVWERLGVLRVAVIAPGASVVPMEGVTTVTDDEGVVAAALARLPGHLILLRPDRYVAACVPIRHTERLVEAVTALLDETWNEGGKF